MLATTCSNSHSTERGAASVEQRAAFVEDLVRHGHAGWASLRAQ